MLLQSLSNQTSFQGTTKIFAMTDSHQETRKTRALLSEVLRRSAGDKNVLLLNVGDIFKGVYSRELEKDSFIKTKDAKPDMEMVTTVGNNDFGFNKDQLDFLIKSMCEFAMNNIRIVCANIFNSAGERPNWLRPYTIVERDGDRSLITGFCINNINSAEFGIFAKNSEEVLEEIADVVQRENPDNFIVLNHDFMIASQALMKKFAEYGIKPDLILGGHDHDLVEPDIEQNIYYPEAFSNNMLIMNLENNNGKTTISDFETVSSDKLKINPDFEKEVVEYEESSGLTKNIAPRILNLTKKYSEPCPLGSFLADEMKNISDSDIAFFSTGFLMKPLEYIENGVINNYDFKKTIGADNTIETVYLTAEELKQVFQHAFKMYGKNEPNTKFIQCSSNIKIQGVHNITKNEWEVKNIYIDGKLIEPNKLYKCCIDSYIANGGQGFCILPQKDKEVVVRDKIIYTVSAALAEGLKKAPQKYNKGDQYPFFEIEDLDKQITFDA